jgi:hypothetical protein
MITAPGPACGVAQQKIINGFVMEKHYSKMGFFNEYY